MNTTIPNSRAFILKGTPLIFCGFKIKATDIKNSLLKLTDLSGALYSFSIRVIKNERPRKKLIIDVELIEGFNPDKYNTDSYLLELISFLKKANRNFREFIRMVPADCFPELFFHSFNSFLYPNQIYQVNNKYFF